jgi:2-aminoadipate transaminase
MTDYSRFFSPTGLHLHESVIRRMGTVAARSADMVSFAAGYPDPASFPWGELRELAAELLSGADPTVLQYGPTRGHEPLIESIVETLAARQIVVTPPEVTITTGSQQGIDLMGRVFVTPGDVVLVELPAYTGAISAFKNAQAQVVGVRQDADGIDLGDLDAVYLRERRAGRRVHLLYLVPNFQNPTGLLLSMAKRRWLLEWAERRDVLIVEDDPYGSLYFDDVAQMEDTRPIKADDSGARVIYLSTFSKTLAPGFRVGWIVAPASLIERFDTAKQSIDLMTGSLDQRIVHAAVRRGVLNRLAPELRRLYRAKRDTMEQALADRLHGQLSWHAPKGGFFLWATLPVGVDDETLLAQAIEERVVFVPGNPFFVDGGRHRQIRLSFSAPSMERIQEGAGRLATAMERATRSAPASAHGQAAR